MHWVATWTWGNELLTLNTDAPLLIGRSGTNATALDARVTIAAGSKYSFSLCYAKGDIGCTRAARSGLGTTTLDHARMVEAVGTSLQLRRPVSQLS